MDFQLIIYGIIGLVLGLVPVKTLLVNTPQNARFIWQKKGYALNNLWIQNDRTKWWIITGLESLKAPVLYSFILIFNHNALYAEVASIAVISMQFWGYNLKPETRYNIIPLLGLCLVITPLLSLFYTLIFAGVYHVRKSIFQASSATMLSILLITASFMLNTLQSMYIITLCTLYIALWSKDLFNLGKWR